MKNLLKKKDTVPDVPPPPGSEDGQGPQQIGDNSGSNFSMDARVAELAREEEESRARRRGRESLKKKKEADARPPLAQRIAVKVVKFRQSLTLRKYLTLNVLFAVGVSSGVAGYSAFKFQYQQSLRDTWAILFLEGEKFGGELAEAVAEAPFKPVVDATSKNRRVFKKPEGVYLVKNNKTATNIVGDLPNFTSQSLGFKTFSFSRGVHVIRIRDKTYVAKKITRSMAQKSMRAKAPKGAYLGVWQFDIQQWLLSHHSEKAQTHNTYFVSKGGKALASVDPSVTDKSLNRRALVQKFISSQLVSADLHFDHESGEPYYGFFFEVPATNVMMFRETSKAAAMSSVMENSKNFAITLLVIILLSLVLLHWSLSEIVRPIGELVVLAQEVARGNFNVRPRKKGFGEVVTLSSTFGTMAQNLVSREKAINELMEEQQEKIRMEREFAVAKSVQDNFLPREPFPAGSGIDLASLYVPAAQVAGDWFNYYHNKKTGDSIVVIVDVSGHDMASSMFTAVIAGIFHETKRAHPDDFPLEMFAEKLNSAILAYGQRQWHATMLVIRHRASEEKITLMNCGHTFPLLFSDERKSKSIILPSTPLGLEEELNACVKDIDFKKGETMLMYTDGFTEARAPNGKMYGAKKLLNTGKGLTSRSVHEFIQILKRDGDSFTKGAQAQDDTCLIALRIVH